MQEGLRRLTRAAGNFGFETGFVLSDFTRSAQHETPGKLLPDDRQARIGRPGLAGMVRTGFSAPDIAGQSIARPLGQIWSGAAMLDRRGEHGDGGVLAASKACRAKPEERAADPGGADSTAEPGATGTGALQQIEPGQVGGARYPICALACQHAIRLIDPLYP